MGEQHSFTKVLHVCPSNCLLGCAIILGKSKFSPGCYKHLTFLCSLYVLLGLELELCMCSTNKYRYYKTLLHCPNFPEIIIIHKLQFIGREVFNCVHHCWKIWAIEEENRKIQNSTTGDSKWWSDNRLTHVKYKFRCFQQWIISE